MLQVKAFVRTARRPYHFEPMFKNGQKNNPRVCIQLCWTACSRFFVIHSTQSLDFRCASRPRLRFPTMLSSRDKSLFCCASSHLQSTARAVYCLLKEPVARHHSLAEPFALINSLLPCPFEPIIVYLDRENERAKKSKQSCPRSQLLAKRCLTRDPQMTPCPVQPPP